jgi:cysteine desulfurase
MSNRIYLDWNATTPLRREAREAMALAWDLEGNPSSVHAEGRKARRLIEESRRCIAAAIGGQPGNTVFTSGGTEANALALVPGLRRGAGPAVERLVVSAIEHASVLSGGRFPAEAVATCGVHRSGLIDLDRLRGLLASGPPALVSVMLANNETGAVQPVAEVAAMVHAQGGLLHLDAIQAFGKISFDINALCADLVTISGHKIGGPKGIGAIMMADGLSGLEPALRGGGQEKGRRAGTENVAGIAGFAAAVKAAIHDLPGDAARLEALRDRLESGLRRSKDVIVFADQGPRLPNTTLFTARGLKAETAVIAFDLEGIAVSSGSACSSGKVQSSHVLTAMGFGPELAKGAIRVSLGWSTTADEVDCCLEAWRRLQRTLLKGSDETELERF